jgi:hypothetical protein
VTPEIVFGKSSIARKFVEPSFEEEISLND